MPLLGPDPGEAPQAIIFDIGRVIIRVDLSRSMESLSKRDGLTHVEALRELERDPRWIDWQEGRISPRDWHAHLAKKFEFSYDFDEFCRIWNGVLVPGQILSDELFERLAGRRRLALLSNTDPIHVAHIEANYSFVRYFSARVYSCRIGSSKPAPPIYHRALRELAALPRETLFVDDVLENAVAAQRLGIQAHHFTSADDLLEVLRRWGC